MLQQLRRAIISRKTARFRYHTRFTEDGKGKQRVREADPYGMLNAGGTWYMVAHCHLRRDTRIFRLDRVADLSILDRRFERPPGFKMTEPEPPEQRNIVVRALFDKEIAPWVREARSYFVVDMEEKPEGLLVILKVRMESEIVQWLLGWGGNVRVLEPDSLRRRLAEEGKRIIENNRNL
jgi:predicted DNA-binding transcriptional regulator YafY